MTVRRVAMGAVLLAGITFLVVPLALGAIGRSRDAQNLLDGVRPFVVAPGTTRLRDAVQAEQATAKQAFLEVPPMLARALHEPPAAFQAQLEVQWPAVAQAQRQFPTTQQVTIGPLATLAKRHHDLTLVDEFPLPGLALSAAVWATVVVGLLIVAVGAWGLIRPGPAPLWAALGLGLVIVIAAFAIRLPTKSAAAHRVVQVVKITPQTSAATRQHFNVDQAAFDQFEHEVIPAVSSRLRLSPDALLDQVSNSVPGFRANLAALPNALRDIDPSIRFRESNVRTFASVRHFPFVALGWLEIALGTVIALLGGIGLLSGGRRRGAPTPERRRTGEGMDRFLGPVP